MNATFYPSKANGESGRVWRVYPAGTVDAVIAEDFPEWEGEQIHSACDCTGRTFSYPVQVRRVPTAEHVLNVSTARPGVQVCACGHLDANHKSNGGACVYRDTNGTWCACEAYTHRDAPTKTVEPPAARAIKLRD